MSDGSEVERSRTARSEVTPADAARSDVTPMEVARAELERSEAAQAVRTHRRAVRTVSSLFGLSLLAALGFAAANFVADKHASGYTQYLGLSLGIAAIAGGAGLTVWAKRLMPGEDAVQEREPLAASAEDEAATDATIGRAVGETQILRTPLLRRMLLGMLGGFGVIAVVPALNLVDSAPHRDLFVTRWRAGSRLVTPEGTPIRIGDVEIGGLVNVLPEGHLDLGAQADSSVVLIRLPPDVALPPAEAERGHANHVAFSKICTHAGCPVSMFQRQPMTMLCPCHQSVFAIAEGAKPIFGPAARPLPQLPITVDADGYFVARGDFSEPVGPSFWSRS